MLALDLRFVNMRHDPPVTTLSHLREAVWKKLTTFYRTHPHLTVQTVRDQDII